MTWKAGSAQTITWTASDNVGVTAVDLAYSTDGGATYPNAIATGPRELRHVAWTVPNISARPVRVRVTARDAAGNSAAAANTANFTVDKWIVTASAGTGGTISPGGAVGVRRARARRSRSPRTRLRHLGRARGRRLGGRGDSYVHERDRGAHDRRELLGDPVNYTITASAGTGGTISPSGAVSVTAGANQAFTIAANAGSHDPERARRRRVGRCGERVTRSPTCGPHPRSRRRSPARATPAGRWRAAGSRRTSADVANWTNNFASGVGATYWASVAVGGSTAIPSATKITTAASTFVSGTTGGVQKA